MIFISFSIYSHSKSFIDLLSRSPIRPAGTACSVVSRISPVKLGYLGCNVNRAIHYPHIILAALLPLEQDSFQSFY